MKTKNIVSYAVYLSIFLFMGFTPYLGYIKISAIKITLMCIPVVMITMHLGSIGAIFGGFFLV